MKIPSRHIWKTVNEAGRYQADLRDRNLHIGKTMRDLQRHSEEKYNKRIQALLETLERAERQSHK
ncbi:hypothetical protein I7I49_13810 [Sinorhizobium meliloti]|uniref:hypothetical protein n=1 Tax=Rhizobium meliloti TaxID=382 RepID=UPI00237FD204|nr:hypothetical protein [Sinorhizobium meliloti]MDE3811350.1 hypothetical protein [Sinorhizobium meliloti]